MSSDLQPVRFGILGAASIARAFIAGVKSSSRVVVTAIGSRDPEKARRFADENGVERSYGTYEGLLADPDVDAIYNPLPNSMHAEWSIRACEEGKHVLCEKPLCMSGREARAMFEAATRSGVHLLEGYPYRAQPQTIRLLELIAAGAIGRIQLVQSSFGFTLAPGNNIRNDPALGGGALMDAGAYPVSLARMVARQRPVRVQALARWSGGVDRAVAGTIEFESGLLAQIACSFSTGAHRQATIAGTEGVIRTSYSNHPPLDRPTEILLSRGIGWDAPQEVVRSAPMNGFLAEAESFAQVVRSAAGSGDWAGATPEESIDIAMTLEAIMHSARTGNPVAV